MSGLEVQWYFLISLFVQCSSRAAVPSTEGLYSVHDTLSGQIMFCFLNTAQEIIQPAKVLASLASGEIRKKTCSPSNSGPPIWAG